MNALQPALGALAAFAAATALGATTSPAASAAPATPGASASSVKVTGRTLAGSQLATDVLNRMATHTRSTGGCATLSAVHMEVMPRTYAPVQPAVAATARGGHFEQWTLDACGAQRKFQVGMWPSPQGGSDFAITPLAVAASRADTTMATSGTRPAQPGSLSGWHGRYVWEEALGRNGGSTPAEGVAAFVTYTLVLGPTAGPTGCALHSEGFQTFQRIQCTATPQGESLAIKFYKFGPDNIRGSYRMGEPLLTLARAPAGIVTRLQGLKPASDATPRSGALFKVAR